MKYIVTYNDMKVLLQMEYSKATMMLLTRLVMLIVGYVTQKNVVILASVNGLKSLENV